MSLKNAKILAPASFLATYLSLVIWMGGMKYTQASIASALNQMGAIFIFILAAIFLKEKITLLKLTAVIIAFAGAILVSFPF
jgi:drug/metabolite transporter (DMT)-like permease